MLLIGILAWPDPTQIHKGSREGEFLVLFESLVLCQAVFSSWQLEVAHMGKCAPSPVLAAVSRLLSRAWRDPVIVVVADQVALVPWAISRRSAVGPAASASVPLAAFPLLFIFLPVPFPVLLLPVRQAALLHTILSPLFSLPVGQW